MVYGVGVRVKRGNRWGNRVGDVLVVVGLEVTSDFGRAVRRDFSAAALPSAAHTYSRETGVFVWKNGSVSMMK